MERKGVCMKIGIYGGTFNPPHLGHLEAARTAVKVLELDKLILIPAAVPPHKALPEGTPEGAHRLAMTERMADALSMPKVAEVSRMELDGRARAIPPIPPGHPGSVPGRPAVAAYGDRHVPHPPPVARPGVITQLAGICAFGRTEQDGEELFAPQREFLSQKYQAQIVTITLAGTGGCVLYPAAGAAGPGEGQEYLLPRCTAIS